MGISRTEFRTKIRTSLKDAQRALNAFVERLDQGEVENAVEKQPEDGQHETFGMVAEEVDKLEKAIDRLIVKTARRINSSAMRRLVRGVWKDPNPMP